MQLSRCVLILGDRSHERDELRKKKESATIAWNRVEGEWQARAGRLAFDSKLAELEKLKRELDQLPTQRLRMLEDLKRRHFELQMEHFLDGFDIDRAQIWGIGPGRKQVLIAYGVETAADITKTNLATVPGIGRVLAAKLIDWRDSLEPGFTFDPTKQIDPQHVAKVEQDVLSQRKAIEKSLQGAVGELRTVGAQILNARHHMRPHVDAAYASYSEAVADFEATK